MHETRRCASWEVHRGPRPQRFRIPFRIGPGTLSESVLESVPRETNHGKNRVGSAKQSYSSRAPTEGKPDFTLQARWIAYGSAPESLSETLSETLSESCPNPAPYPSREIPTTDNFGRTRPNTATPLEHPNYIERVNCPRKPNQRRQADRQAVHTDNHIRTSSQGGGALQYTAFHVQLALPALTS